MEINSILFPSPPPSYTKETFPDELIWVPSSSHPSTKIPCLLLQSVQGSSKLLIYFHGNAEDIGLAYEMTDLIRTSLQIHVLVMEYPGYGLYAGKTKAETILQDADSVYDFASCILGFASQDIFAFWQVYWVRSSDSNCQVKRTWESFLDVCLYINKRCSRKRSRQIR